MSIYDSEHLPKLVTDIIGIKDILLAINPEIQLLREDITGLEKELYIKTTEKYISRWEKEFNLPYNASLTLQERRLRVLNKLARKKTLTFENLKLLIRNNLDNPQFYLSNHSSQYHFTIMVQTPNYKEMEQAVAQAKPAYLTFDVIVTEYFRRTDTFNCGSNPV